MTNHFACIAFAAILLHRTTVIYVDAEICPPRSNKNTIQNDYQDHQMFFVDIANGNDSWSGSLDAPNADGNNGPFLTLEGAIFGVRRQRVPEENAVLFVRQGTYFVADPIIMNSKDTGLSIVGYPDDDRPLISGGYKIAAEDFHHVSDGTFAAEYAGHCWRHVFLGEKRLVRARKPNLIAWNGNEMTGEGPYLYIKNLLEPTSTCNIDGSGGFTQSCPDENKNGFIYFDGDLDPSWSNYSTGEIVVFQAWTAERGQIGLIDTDNKVYFVSELLDPIGEHPIPSGWRYIIENIFEELDAEGEFFCDDVQKKIFVIPPNGEFGGDDVYVGSTDAIFRGKGVTSLHFVDLEFRYTHDNDFGGSNARPAALDFTESEFITFKRCSFAHSGYTAIYLETCINTVISECYFYDIGKAAIHVEYKDNLGDVLANRNIGIYKNTFIGCGVFNMFQPACIHVQGVGNIRVSDNEISRSPYAGMRIGWQSTFNITQTKFGKFIFYIRRNHIYDFGMKILNDFGGIYLSTNAGCGKRDSDPSICFLQADIRHNIVHNGRAYYYGAIGVYSDTALSGLRVARNWLYDLGDTSINFHCGQYNFAINNMIFHNSDLRVFGTCNAIVGQGEEPKQILAFVRNCIYINNTEALMFRNSDPWTYDVPKCDENVYYFNPMTDEQLNNFFPHYLSLQEWRNETGNDMNSIIKDPLYWSIPSDDYRLRDNSPAYALGIQSIDLRSVRSNSGIC